MLGGVMREYPQTIDLRRGIAIWDDGRSMPLHGVSDLGDDICTSFDDPSVDFWTVEHPDGGWLNIWRRDYERRMTF